MLSHVDNGSVRSAMLLLGERQEGGTLDRRLVLPVVARLPFLRKIVQAQVHFLRPRPTATEAEELYTLIARDHQSAQARFLAVASCGEGAVFFCRQRE